MFHEDFKCGIRRRSGSLSLRKGVGRRMIFDHLRLMSSLLEIQQTLPRTYFRFFLMQLFQASKSQTDQGCTFSGR